MGTMLCEVCGGKATGTHYGVMACEGCKAFYRRATDKNIRYLCYFGSNCPSTTNTRACCKACRFQRCVTLGMRIYGAKVGKERGKKTGKWKKELDRKQAEKLKSKENIRKQAVVVHRSVETQTDQESHLDTGSTDTEDLPELDFAFLSSLDANFDGLLSNIVDDAADCAPFHDDFQTTSDSHDSPVWLDEAKPDLLGFMSLYVKILDSQRQRMDRTLEAVTVAVKVCFADQLVLWQDCLDQHVNFGLQVHQPETSLETMIDTVQMYAADCRQRSQKFAAMLPGMTELDTHGKRNATIGWKWVAFWLIHHAPYMTSEDTFITMGEHGIRYCRYWQHIISEWPLVVFIYKFCGQFRDIGLTQIETYLVLAVMMFEPAVELNNKSPEAVAKVSLIHRHYADVLMDTIKRRCSDGDKLNSTIQKLDQFFSTLKLVYQLHQHYLRALDCKTLPLRATLGQRQVTVEEALSAGFPDGIFQL